MNKSFKQEKPDPIRLAQTLMDCFGAGPDRPLADANEKKFWVDVAEHMGPDYCQAMYHAAVFMTRVA